MSHFIVARLNGESRHIKIKKINFSFSHLHCLDTLHLLVSVAKKWVHLNCMVPLFSLISIKKGNDCQYLASDLIHIYFSRGSPFSRKVSF